MIQKQNRLQMAYLRSKSESTLCTVFKCSLSIFLHIQDFLTAAHSHHQPLVTVGLTEMEEDGLLQIRKLARCLARSDSVRSS